MADLRHKTPAEYEERGLSDFFTGIPIIPHCYEEPSGFDKGNPSPRKSTCEDKQIGNLIITYVSPEKRINHIRMTPEALWRDEAVRDSLNNLNYRGPVCATWGDGKVYVHESVEDYFSSNRGQENRGQELGQNHKPLLEKAGISTSVVIDLAFLIFMNTMQAEQADLTNLLEETMSRGREGLARYISLR